jgi:hypothetical protein
MIMTNEGDYGKHFTVYLSKYNESTPFISRHNQATFPTPLRYFSKTSHLVLSFEIRFNHIVQY